MDAVDLFAGCGGLSLGFQNIGYNITAAFEFWDTAATCYEKNFTHPVFRIDLSNIDSAVKQIKKFSPDVIIGGPPCQDFSHAGKRIEADRADLTESFAQIIYEIRPEYFVMENVDRAAKSRAFEKARSIFKDAGYGLTQMVLDASRCGAPQKRKRFFCIGALGEDDNFLESELLGSLSEKPTTVRDYFGDSLDFDFYYRHPRNYSRRAIFSIDEPAPTMRGVNRPVPKGYPGHPNDACPLNDNIRALTTLERSMIQTFPQSYVWFGSKTDIEQMIGNAVPVKLAEYVAERLDDFMKQKNNKWESTAEDMEAFKKWLMDDKKYSVRSANDVVSRLRRANCILPFDGLPDDDYLYLFQKTNKYADLSPSIRSQIKKAVNFYREYMHL